MNKKGSGMLSSKMGFYIFYLILFTLAIGYSTALIERGEVRRVDFIELEKSVIANRIVSCLSNGIFGEVDESKFNELELRKCLDNNLYSFRITLEKENGPPPVSLGRINVNSQGALRFVLVNGEKAKLRVVFSKDVSN